MSKPQPAFDTLTTEAESLVDRGSASQAADRLRNLPLAQIPRRFLARLANTMRRTGLAQQAVRALHPVVRNPAKSDATVEERSVYAASLVKLGIADEAIEILDTVPAADFPDSLLFRSHALVSRWNYDQSIEVLERYLELPLKDSQRMLGQMNLAAALVHEGRYPAAEELLKSIEHENEAPDRAHFLGNTYELLAQWAVGTRQWDACRLYLGKAEKILGGTNTVDAFFVRKWRAIAGILEKGPGKRQTEALLSVCAEAVRIKHWETVRDCDLFRAIAAKAKPIAVHLYVGTPFESFRKRIFRDFPGSLTIPDFYDWGLSGPNRKGKIVTTVVNPPGNLRPLGLQLLRTLSTDFYRPFRIGELARTLFPDEYFNPESTPARVHRAVGDLRKWLGEEKIELGIIEEDGYRISRSSDVTLRVPGRRNLEKERRAHGPLASLKGKLGAEPFSATQATELLGEPRRSVARWLKEGVESGELVRSGTGSRTEYRFARPK